MSDRYFEGLVDWFRPNLGWIEYEESGRHQRIFFCDGTIRADEIGRTSQCWISGTPVRFRIQKDKSRGRVDAVDVHPIFCEPFVGDPKEHREISVVDRFIETNVDRLAGFLRRESGEDLYFGWKNIDPAFRNRRNILRQGDPVWHGIRIHTNGKFEASHIGIYSRDEIDRMAQGLQPYELDSDPEPIEPQPVPATAASEATPDSVLAPSTCSLPLIEIIKRRKR
jgi:hypothetical protein